MKKKAYLCMTDFDHDLATDNLHDVDLFGSLDSLKIQKKCWKQCGVYEVEVTVVGDASPAQPGSEE
jgi:hypothetical protein